MRAPKETAAHMIKQYGKDAGVHCMYAIMNNETNEAALAYWRAVDQEIVKEWKNERHKAE
jgi:ketol-acid reductoisomerase